MKTTEQILEYIEERIARLKEKSRGAPFSEQLEIANAMAELTLLDEFITGNHINYAWKLLNQ